MITHQIRRLLCRTRKSVKVTNVLGNVRSWHEADQVTEVKVRCERTAEVRNFNSNTNIEVSKSTGNRSATLFLRPVFVFFKRQFILG